MKILSVSSKLNIAIAGISLVSLMAAFFILTYYSHMMERDVYSQTRKELLSIAYEDIESKKRVGITNAISIANDERITKALKDNERKYAIESLKDISKNMKENTSFHNIKIHLHTKDNKSFLRNWKQDKYGDDLSSFRSAVVAVNKTVKPIVTFEPGRAGLLLRAITPIVRNGHHYGSLEFIQGINSVVKIFDKENMGFLLLMDKEVQNEIKTGKNFSFSKNKFFKNYIISQKFVNQSFLSDAQSIDMGVLLQNGYLLSSQYFYTFMPVKSFENKNLGIVLLAKPLSVVNRAVDGAKNLIYMALIGILLMTIIISIVMMMSVRKLVIKPLKIFENGLMNFFQFLQGKQAYTEIIEINTNDEFGEMSHSLKDNMAVSAQLHEEINDLNSNLEAKVEEKTREVTILLDNAGQGFLSFGCDLIIHERYSKECNKLLGENLGGKYLAEILFAQSSKQKFFQQTILEACRIDSLIVQKSILSLLPNEIIHKRRALKLTYKILENKHMMLIVTNITSQKKLEKKVKKEQETLRMIVEIISESDSFYDTLREYELFIANHNELINQSKTSLYNINELYRTIHTFKGAFAQLYLNDIVNFLHSLESEIARMIKDNEHTNESLVSFLKNCDFQTSLQKELDIIRDVLGSEFLDSQNFIKINVAEIKNLQSKIQTIFRKENLKSAESKEIVKQVSTLANQKLVYLLKQYTGLVQQLAQKLEKEIYAFEIIGDKEILVSDKFKPFIKSLLHVFRNSVDHGIEDPNRRLENNKDEKGTISCSFSQDSDSIQIIISDDGAGIDKEKVLLKAIEKNLISKEEASTLSEHEIYNLIFSENFSTKDEVTTTSGRGVGMNAVKVEIEKLHGYIEINSQKNIGTTFIFNIPHKKGDM